MVISTTPYVTRVVVSLAQSAFPIRKSTTVALRKSQWLHALPPLRSIRLIRRTISAVTISTTRQVSPSLPLLLNPTSPTGQDTNTFSLHSRQSSVNAKSSGPQVFGLTAGGEMYMFFSANITDANYGLFVYFAYGEL